MTPSLPSLRRGALVALLALAASITAAALPAHADEVDTPGGNADPVVVAEPALTAQATITKVGSQDPAQLSTLRYDNETVAVAQGNSVDVRLTLSGGGAAEGVSVASLSGTYKDHDAQRKGGHPADTLPATVEDLGNGTYRLTFKEGMVVDLSSISLTAQPAGGGTSVPVAIAFADNLPSPVPDAIATTPVRPASKPSVQLSLNDNSGWKHLDGNDYARKLDGAKLSDLTFTMTSTDPLFRLFLSDANRAEYPKLSATAPDGTALQAKPDLSTLKYENGSWSVSWTLAPPTGTASTVSEGTYQVHVDVDQSTHYDTQGTHDISFMIDGTSPTIELSDGWNRSDAPQGLQSDSEGYHVRIKVTDGPGDAPSGVDVSSLHTMGVQSEVQMDQTHPGDYVFTFSSDADVHDILDARVFASDRVGNRGQGVRLGDLLDAQDSLTIKGMDTRYHRDGVMVTASVRAPFANGTDLHGRLKATIRNANGNEEELPVQNVPLKQRGTSWPDSQWFDLNTVLGTENHYVKVQLEVDEPGVTLSTDDDFYVDRTAPTVGNVRVSPQPVVTWGHAFTPGATTIHMEATDAVSGVDWDSLALTASDGTPVEGVQVKHDADNPDGTPSNGITITLASDGQTLDLTSTRLHLRDLAGNPLVDPDDPNTEGLLLSGLMTGDGKPLAKDTTDIVVDTTAPVVSVSYDNNDARGSYYNKARTVTITVVEGSFSYIRDNDAERAIATIGVDGTTHDVTARQFENPSGDGVTWVYTEELSQDGDWTVDVSLTDPVGYASNEVHDAFTIDTLAPMITVEFDNNDARSGMYFNRPRTATVTVRERNFDPSLMGVSASAKDASGNAADAPGASGWSATGEEDTWSCTVHFGGELHYGLSVSAADPAGNQAEAYEVPEFVIDMTPPQASIEHVENKTAYAGEIAPSLSMSDTNLAIGNSKYSLTGAHSGKVDYMRGMETSYSDTSESVTYADFEHKVERDDVYTLAVHAEDLAGNASDVTRVFSVNRYGSNYLYSDATAGILGAYLRIPQDVVITEINVSGLDDDGTHVELAHDSEVTDLMEGASYTTETADDSGWSKTTYTIPASNFSQDGYYRVMMTSHDKAGNLAQNTMGNKDATREHAAEVNFAVDATAPTVGFAGAKTGGVYFGASHDALPLAGDNLALDRVTLQVDDGEPEELSPDEFAGGPASLPIPADAKLHTLTIAAYDKAGNVHSTTLGSVAVAPNWVEYLKANPNLLFAFVAFVVMALGLAAMGIVLGVRHHRATEGLRNPFGH
ncbi:group 3 Ig-like domain protein [Olsenella profusa]|uniref:Group 3 Ig-like domain protein n=1 Tax=Olsenella profusa F0195 TaxID=1125712 RepID=U2TSG0_9ACTN|nr:group 3 Ig-like domain protein [Olsenella profusa]ERL09290.1 group 3 Ig-like domain protein [Olsenella profusa F0195]